MKIGDVEVKKIPFGQSVFCLNGCGNAIAYFNEAPYCANCLQEEQQEKWEADGNFFINSEGERVHYEIVRKVS